MTSFLPVLSSLTSRSTFALVLLLNSFLFSSILIAEDESDIVKVEVRNIEPSHDYGLGPSFTKEFSLVGKDKKKEKIRVMKKPSLFNKNFKMSNCGKSGCKEEPLAADEEERATRCSFSGKIDSDPDSTVHISGCPEEESIDISLMSKKSNLEYNTYRMDRTGRIKVDKNSTFIDAHILAEEENEGSDYFFGSDYSDDDDDDSGFASVLINGYTYSYVKKDPRNGEKCCRPIKSKCEETIVQNSEKMPKKRRDTCKITRGEILCGKRCTAIIKALEKLQRKVEKDEKSREHEEKEITKEEEKLKDLEKEQEKEIIVEEKENKDYIKERTEAPKRKPEPEPITSNVNRRVTDVPHSSEEHHSEEEDSFEHYSVEDSEETSSEAEHPKADLGGGAKGLKVKKGQKLTQKQLQRLENAAEEKETESKNPLCKEQKKTSFFRSGHASIHMHSSGVHSCGCCISHGKSQCTELSELPDCNSQLCRKKQPRPKEKIYEEKTIEVGVYIDRHLYQHMERVLKTQDEANVKDQFLKMIHSLFVQVETFLMHPTFTSKGGFRISINGITIFQKYGPLESQWDSVKKLITLLRSFQGFANKVNSNCDGDRDSYDAMVLLTGRYDYEEMGGGDPETSSMGYCLTGMVCTSAPALVLTLHLDEEDNIGSHTPVMPKLLAHELGHLLGSEHDGQTKANYHSSIYAGQTIPCPEGKNLMSPSVSDSTTTWSECTRKQIDAEFERREKENENCFFT